MKRRRRTVLDSGATYTPGVSERRGTTTTYLHSGLKNAFAQSGTSQTVTATPEYDAFGNVMSQTGTWAGAFGYAGKFGYQSKSIPGTSTPDDGLQLLGHRYYDPTTGRFLTRDPIFDGRNWYSYGGGEGNPLTMSDPTGLYDWSNFGNAAGSASNNLLPGPGDDYIVVSLGDNKNGGNRFIELKPGQATPTGTDWDYILVICKKTGQVGIWKIGAFAGASVSLEAGGLTVTYDKPIIGSNSYEILPGSKYPGQYDFDGVWAQVPKSFKERLAKEGIVPRAGRREL